MMGEAEALRPTSWAEGESSSGRVAQLGHRDSRQQGPKLPRRSGGKAWRMERASAKPLLKLENPVVRTQ